MLSIKLKNIHILYTCNVMSKDLSSSQHLLVFPCPLIILLRILFGIPIIIYKIILNVKQFN